MQTNSERHLYSIVPALFGALSVESAEGGRRRQLGELLLVHEATPISALRRDKPSRIRVFTVPSGAPTSAAISL